jgi:class 3 adenylate cyclase
MSLIRLLLYCFIALIPVWGHAQVGNRPEAERVDSILDRIQTNQQIDAETKSKLADEAFQLALKAGDTCRQILARVKQATYLDNMGKADSALTQLYWASRYYLPGCDSLILMSLYANLSNVYLSLNELDRIDTISQRLLSQWNPAWKNKNSRFAILNNLGIAQASRGSFALATITFHKALSEAEADDNKNYIETALLNLGSIKGVVKDLDSAYFFFSIAAKNAKRNTNVDSYMSLLINMANVDMERGKYKSALTLLDSVYTLADTLKSIENLAYVQRSRANLYAGINDYKSAYGFLNEYLELNARYLDEERVKAVTEMMEKYESEKKARQIQQLELDKLDATLKTERLTNTRNRYLYIGIFILLVAAGISTRLQYVHKSRAAIQKEKDISDGLLLNILPAAVADELKQKGYAKAMHHDIATILFSDFKGFTAISETLSAAELVEEINTCFKAFDNIITKYGIEKIKTIGDSYMAAGGIPANNTATVLDIVKAALEMQDFIISRKQERDLQHLPSFQMRIGLHTGPVVAGIVGVKKFQYDIWGDTVNIASRMESSGEVGKVNISEATYQHIKNDPGLMFVPRGMIEAKGKGEMAMYFVQLI